MDEDNGGFIRQRRNLVVASALVLFVLITDTHVGGLGFGSATVTVNEPRNAYWILWASIIYFVWRYRHYYQGTNAFQQIRARVWTEVAKRCGTEFSAEIKELIEVAKKHFEDKNRKAVMAKLRYEVRYPVHEDMIVNHYIEKRGINVEIHYNYLVLANGDQKISKGKLDQFNKAVEDIDDGVTQTTVNGLNIKRVRGMLVVNHNYENRKYLGRRLWSHVIAWLDARSSSEYIFPLVFSGLAILAPFTPWVGWPEPDNNMEFCMAEKSTDCRCHQDGISANGTKNECVLPMLK